MISEWFHSVCGTCTAYMNNADFILGLSLGAAIVLIIVLAVLYFRCQSEHCNAVTIEGEHGYFQMTGNAMRNFVEKLASEFADMSLQKMKLSQNGKNISIKLVLSASASSDLAVCQEKLRQRLLEEAEAKLGLKDQISAINIVFSKLTVPGQDSAEEGDTAKPANIQDTPAQ
jgi:hypothetical protein